MANLSPPVVLFQEDVSPDAVRCMAVSPDATRVYLGRHVTSDPGRRNLVVLKLRPARPPRPDGDPVSYRDCEDPLPARGGQSGVYRILIDPTRRGVAGLARLYLAVFQLPPGGPNTRLLTVYDLDANWDPVGPPRSYQWATNGRSAQTLRAMALHPSLARLYLGGDVASAVFAYAAADLAADAVGSGGPVDRAALQPMQVDVPTQPLATFEIAIHPILPIGARMYLGSLSGAEKRFEVMGLDPVTGAPQPGTAPTFFPGPVPPEPSLPSIRPGEAVPQADGIGFTFHFTPAAIYRRRERPGFDKRFPHETLGVWPLDPATGLPVGPRPTEFSNIQHAALAPDPKRGRLWVAADSTFTDAFLGVRVRDGVAPAAYRVRPDGSPDVRPDGRPNFSGQRFQAVHHREGCLVAVAGNGTAVVLTEAMKAESLGNQVRGYFLRLTVAAALDPGGAPPPGDGTRFQARLILRRLGVGEIPVASYPALAIGAASDAVSLDPFLAVTDGRTIPDRSAFTTTTGQRMFHFIVDTFTLRNPDGSLTPVTLSPPLRSLTLTVEVFDGDPAAGGRPIAPTPLTETVAGNDVEFLLPAYDPAPPGTRGPGRDDGIELLSGHARRRYRDTAQQVAVPAGDRPRQFLLSCNNLAGDQGQLDQLRNQAEAVVLLGMNAAGPEGWNRYPDPADPFPSDIRAQLTAAGLTRITWAKGHPLQGAFDSSESSAFRPLTYMDFFYVDPDGKPTARMGELERWVSDQFKAVIRATGCTADQVAGFAVLDDQFWEYPAISNLVGNPSNGFLPSFRAYLRRQGEARGFGPAFFGAATWDDPALVPTDADVARGGAPAEARRRFYWTTRFFAEAAAGGMAVVRRAFEDARRSLAPAGAATSPLYCIAHWGAPFGASSVATDAPGQWYISGGRGAGAKGVFDWMESGRRGSHALETQEGLDTVAQDCSVMAEGLRSAAMLGGASAPPFGGLVRVQSMGGHPHGAAYRALSFLGRGGKFVDVYTFGPELYTGDGWGERVEKYQSVADAMKLVGRAERLLFPGRPERGKVAVLLPHVSVPWDDVAGIKRYAQEVRSLHYALVHAGYTVDFVDDTDLADGALAPRGYTTLYVTGPNVSSAAQARVADWVAAGGTLAVTPGAATADEYDDPTTVMDGVLGLRPGSRSPDRSPVLKSALTGPGPIGTSPDDDQPAGAMDVIDPRLAPGLTGAGGAPPGVDLFGPVAALELASPPPDVPASVAASVAGRPVLTVRPVGAGTAVAYGLFPGRQYWTTPFIGPGGVPRGWGRVQRQIAVAPARLAGTTSRVALSHEGVEALYLDAGDDGFAVVLLNWTYEPVASLTVTVPITPGLRAGPLHAPAVTTGQGAPVGVRVSGQLLELTLPLPNVDVLLVEPRNPMPTSRVRNSKAD